MGDGKISDIMKLALKRSERWCSVATDILVVQPGDIAGEERKATLFGAEALQHIATQTTAALKAKQFDDLGLHLFKPFKMWKWLLPEAQMAGIRSLMSQVAAVTQTKGGDDELAPDDREDIIALRTSSSPSAASSSCAAGSACSTGSALATKEQKKHVDFLKFFQGKHNYAFGNKNAGQ